MAKLIVFTKAKAKPKKPKQGASTKATLNKLKQFINTNEPDTVKLLVNNLHGAGDTITYKELREAYLAGGFSPTYTDYWQKKYSKIVDTVLRPKWEQAAAEAAQEAKDHYHYFLYEPSVSAATAWIKDHGAELVTNLAKDQVAALNAMVGHISGYTAITPDEAARMMRPCIGLTKPQAVANLRYRESVKDAYLKAHPNGKPETAERKAKEAAARYAARQHRYRAQMIARTELAFGYNAGHHGATKDAQAQGYIGDCKKKWLTAYDERVCPICSAMDGETVGMDDPFSNGVQLPPAHPHCRCAVAYEEIDNTNLNPQTPQGTIQPQTPPTQPQSAPQPTQTAPPPPIQTPQPTAPAGAASVPPEGGYKMSEIIDKPSLLPRTEHGTAIRSDGGMVENLNLSGRTVTIDGQDYCEITGKLTEDSWHDALKYAKAHGHESDFEILLRGKNGAYTQSDRAFTMDGYRIAGYDGSTFDIYSDQDPKDLFGMRGFFRARVPMTGMDAADSQAVRDVFDNAGLAHLLENPTDADELWMRKCRLAWQTDPKTYETFRTGYSRVIREDTIDRILKKAGYTEEQIMAMEVKEVVPGYNTLYAGERKNMSKATHVWAGTGRDPETVVEITKGGGFRATNQRVTSGIQKIGEKGASEEEDMRTGGSGNVFTRIGIANSNAEYRRNYKGGGYRILIDRSELQRTDWYAYLDDSFGVARYDRKAFKERLNPQQFVWRNSGKKYHYDNEIMFPNGISSEKFIGISCPDEQMRQDLIAAYRNAGITEVNGVALEDFCRVSQTIGEDTQLGIQGLSFYDEDVPFF